jgi:hypothetical protein
MDLILVAWHLSSQLQRVVFLDFCGFYEGFVSIEEQQVFAAGLSPKK